MTEETNQSAATDTAAPATTETPAKAPAAPRFKLTIKHGDTEQPLLKYPFPVKAPKFPVKVNGAEVQAATTAGKGKAYTYFLINNTSFYVPGVIAPDTELTVNFPEGYKFDDVVAPRVSTYKPKKPKADKPVGEGAAADASASAAAGGEAGTAESSASGTAEAQPSGEKASRRKK